MITGTSKIKVVASTAAVLLTGVLATVGLVQTSSAAAAAATSTPVSGLTPSPQAETSKVAEISRAIDLADKSTGSAFLPYAQDRDIWLKDGTYLWQNTFLDSSNNLVHVDRTIKLKQGWYTWGCVLNGTGEVFSATTFNYITSCRLGGASLPYSGVSEARLHGGSYIWASYLSVVLT